MKAVVFAFFMAQVTKVSRAVLSFEGEFSLLEDYLADIILDDKSKIGPMVRPFFEERATVASQAMIDDYGVEVDKDIVRRVLDAQEIRFADDITKTTVSNIRKQVSQGIENDETLEQISKRIVGYYERNANRRAYLAAQYESGTCYEGVRYAIAKDQGLNKKRWMTMQDDRVEIVCQKNEEEGAIPIDKKFSSGHLVPLAHPECRCFLTYSL